MLNIKDAKQATIASLDAGLVPFLFGQPGLGKSAIVKEIAAEKNYKLIDLRLSQLIAFDLNGFPDVSKDTVAYKPVDIFPLETTALNGYNGFLLFLDEFNQADRSVLAAAYKLLLDKAIGHYKLHPDTHIVCAGNKVTDGAMANSIGSALTSRIVHIEVKHETKSFLSYLEDRVIANDFNSMVFGFLNFMPQSINTFDADKAEEPFGCPRTWDFVSSLMPKIDTLNKEVQFELLSGCVGEKSAQDLSTYLDIYKELPTVQEILENPTKAKRPEKVAAVWAVIGLISEHISKENAEKFLAYFLDVKQQELVVLALRMWVRKVPSISSNKKVLAHLGDLAKAINGK